MKKDSGKLDIVMSVSMIVFVLILLMSQIQVWQWETTSSYVEDALANSNLASAVIDIEEYGTTGEVVISDMEYSYNLYKEALKSNLELNDNWESKHKSLISGPVSILNYTVYNVMLNGDIQICTFNETGSYSVSTVANGKGTVKDPNGVTIENTSIYSEITMRVDGSFGISIDAVKDNLVDIVSTRVVSSSPDIP